MTLEEENARLCALVEEGVQNTKRSVQLREAFQDECARLRLLLKEAGEALSILDKAGHRNGLPAKPEDPEDTEEAYGYGFAMGMTLAAENVRPVLAKIKAELEQKT